MPRKKTKRHKTIKPRSNTNTKTASNFNGLVQVDSKRNLGLFREIVILIVSLLHGTLFFVLCDKLIELINDFSVLNLSYLTFFFSLFFRIFQTHILAAIKYSEKWIFRPMDFVLVFMASMFEYLLFQNEKITSTHNEIYYYMIVAFCIFGMIGYYVTYIRTNKMISCKEKSKEKAVQVANIICVFLIGLMHLLYFYNFVPAIFKVYHMNFISSILLAINIYLSLYLSKSDLQKEIVT